MRYEARFRNGIWQVFDRSWYGVVGSARTFKEASVRAAELNNRKAGGRK